MRRRKLVLVVMVALVLAACGGSDEGSSVSGEQSSPTEEPKSDRPSGDTEPVDGEAVTDVTDGDQWAVVKIGSETYEFGAGEYNHCLITEEGIFKATFLGEDGLVLGESFISLEVSLPPDGLNPADLLMPWDAYPHVTVVIGESEEWEANAYESTSESTSNRNIPEGLTQVDGFQFDVSGASGAATFLDMENLTHDQETSSFSGDPMTGSFEVSCG